MNIDMIGAALSEQGESWKEVREVLIGGDTGSVHYRAGPEIIADVTYLLATRFHTGDALVVTTNVRSHYWLSNGSYSCVGLRIDTPVRTADRETPVT